MTTRSKLGPSGTEFIVRSEGFSAPDEFGPVQLGSPANDPVSLRAAVENLREEVKSGYATEPALAEAIRARQMFWVETCEAAVGSQPCYRLARELRRKYGWRFCSPTPEQVQFVIDALDLAFAHWERDSAVLFFNKLEVHFPHLQKYSARPH